MGIVDVHFHVFAKDDVKCRLSKRARYRPSGIIAGAMLGILDEALEDDLRAIFRPKQNQRRHAALTSAQIRDRLLKEIRGSTQLDGVVLLALDAIHSRKSGKRLKTDVVTTNDWVHEIITHCGGEVGGKKLYLGASVHPYRKNWRQEVEKVDEWGAKLIKWIPSSQRIDPDDSRLDSFYRELAERKIPLLCHAGPEDAVPDESRKWWPPWKGDPWEKYNDPRRLTRALELGVTVILAHCASPYLPWYALDRSQKDYVPDVADMMNQAKRKKWKLYADISALLLTPTRAEKVKRLFKPPYVERLVYGSDFPIPTNDFSAGRLGFRVDGKLAARARKTKNLLDKDVLSKRAVGVAEEVLLRTAELLGIQ